MSLSAVFLMGAICETVMLTLPVRSLEKPLATYQGSYTNDYFQYGVDLLGYAPKRGVQARSRRSVSSNLIYDVTYTIQNNGLRLSPPVLATNNAPEIWFFGGSFTFGEGVDDEDAMPYQVGVFSGGAYRVRNFGFHGYGPHQMLAALEYGVAERLMEESPTYVIYQVLAGHIARCAGHACWDPDGPMYQLQEDGVRFVGRFSDKPKAEPNWFVDWLLWQFSKSAVFRWVQARPYKPTVRDCDLLVAIVARARDICESRYRDCQFHAIIWDERGGWATRINRDLRKRGVRTHLVSQVTPDIVNFPDEYRIATADPHPNRRAHGLIAQYTVEHILRGK